MKNFKIINYLLIAASGLVFMQCTSDYTSIPGKDGVDGTNGIDGINGVDGVDGVGVQECIDCHSSSHRDVIKEAYIQSGHANGGSWARGKSGECARCHNNQGYIDLLSGNFIEVDDTGEPILDQYDNEIPSADFDGYLTSSAITCTGCHDSEQGHRNFDFATDDNALNDYALRNIDPVKAWVDPAVTIDMTSNHDELGGGNTCVNCHQPRRDARAPFPFGANTDMITITTQRYGPHHGPQGAVLQGILGGNPVGSETYPVVGGAAHKSGPSCTGCHMGEPSDETLADGNHTWEPTLSTCISCHESMTETQFNELKTNGITGFSVDLETLKQLLIDKGWLGDDDYVKGQDGTNASSSNPLVISVEDAKPLWAYKTLEEDHSKGIHNPVYVRALLKNSIEYLQNN
jgi:hypothetical protein